MDMAKAKATRSRRVKPTRPPKGQVQQLAVRPKAKATGERRGPRGRRLWAYRIVTALVMPCLLVALLELALRLSGYGYDPSPIVVREVAGQPTYCDNFKFSWRFFPSRMAREASPFIFPVKKAPNTYRIFVLGGSAAQGTPDGAYAFSRMLDVMLSRRYPDLSFEVVNTAMTAINSHVVLPIARACAPCQGDLFVVYMGNNEVVGPYGPGTVLTAATTNMALIRLAVAVRATRTGQVFNAFFEGRGPGQKQWGGMEMFSEHTLSPDEPHLAAVYDNLRRNLEDICAAAREHGAQVILSTVGVNLRDCAPFASMQRSDGSDDHRAPWRSNYDRGVSLEKEQAYATAIESYLAAAALDSTYADLQFRLGRCYWELSDFEAATVCFGNALACDGLRFRADEGINDAIRNVAGAYGEGVHLVDAANALAQNSPQGLTGQEMFHEHVHLNFAGNYIVAREVFRQVEAILPPRLTQQVKTKGPVLDQAGCAQRLAYTDWDHYQITQRMLYDYISKPPFTGQLYHDQQVRQLQAQISQLQADVQAPQVQASVQAYRSALKDRGGDWLLHMKFARLLSEALKDDRASAQEYRRVVECAPHHARAQAALGWKLLLLGDVEGSIQHNQTAAALNPSFHLPYYCLGVAYGKQHRWKQAERAYRRAIDVQGRFVSSYEQLAQLLYQRDQAARAEQVLRDGIAAVPEAARLYQALGVMLDQMGRQEEAQAALTRAAELSQTNQAGGPEQSMK